MLNQETQYYVNEEGFDKATINSWARANGMELGSISEVLLDTGVLCRVYVNDAPYLSMRKRPFNLYGDALLNGRRQIGRVQRCPELVKRERRECAIITPEIADR